MKKFSDKRGSKEKKIKSFEKLFNFICFLDSSDVIVGMVMVVMAAAIYCAMVLFLRGLEVWGVERRDRLRWMDIGSEFGLCYWCWILFFCCCLVFFVVIFFLGRGFVWGGGVIG